MTVISKQLSALLLILFFAEGLAQDSTSTQSEEEGLVFVTYFSTSIPTRLKHLPSFPGYSTIAGEETGRDDAIKVDIPQYSFQASGTKIQSIDVDVREKIIYMHDENSRSLAYGIGYNAKLDNLTVEYPGIAASSELLQLAVDWLSHTVYWTDTLYRRIIAIPGQPEKIKPSLYKTIINTLGAPTGIAVDPHEGLLFWADVGNERKIERTTLDGNQETRVTFGLEKDAYPTFLELDRNEKRIYWIDSNQKILSMTYMGLDKTLLKSMGNVKFFDMAIFRNVVYVSDTENGYLYTFNTTAENYGKLEANTISNSPYDMFGVTVFSEEAQPLRDKDYCAILNCDQLCISTKEGAKCTCFEGYTLNPTSGNCDMDRKFLNKAIVFANATHICMVNVKVLTSENVNEFCVFTVIKQNKASGGTSTSPSSTTTIAPTAAPGDMIKKFDMDMQKRMLFFVTADNSIYRRPIDLPIENEEKELLATASSDVTGLAFDAEDGNNLYWCESDTNSIWLLNVNSKSVNRVNPENDNRIDSPENIKVLAKERKLVMISYNSSIRYSLKAMSMDGENVDIIVSNKFDLTDFYYNPEDQMFYYKRSSYIYKASPDGSYDKFEYIGVSYRSYIIFKYANFVAWVYSSSSSGNFIKTRNTVTNDIMNTIPFDTYTIVGMKPLDETLQKTDVISPCFYNNGNCSQICITHYVNSKLERMCQCSLGYIVENEVDCKTDIVEDHFLLFTDHSNQEIFQFDNYTNKLHVVPDNEEVEYMGIYFDSYKKRMIWATFRDRDVYSANINGSDRQLHASLGSTGYAYRFDQDSTTRNIYFTAYSSSIIGLILPDGRYTVLIDEFSSSDYVLDITVYPVKGWMYYTVQGTSAYVGRANMDGSNSEMLISGDHVTYPDGLAINHLTDRLYWSDATLDTIQDCDMDGKDCITIVNMTASSNREEIRDLVTDGFYLYYSTYRKDHVTRVSLTYPYTRTILGQHYALGKIDTMTLYSSTNLNIQKLNPHCQAREGLGDCTTICIPTSIGRTCACEDGISLKSTDERACENIFQCTPEILQKVNVTNGDEINEITIEITMDRSCLRLLNETCNYQCPINYEPLLDTEMSCTNEGWSMESHTLCKEVRCPRTVENGTIIGNCKREVGDKCDYQCDTGFVKTRELAVCTKTGQYHVPSEGLCEPFQCREYIENGKIDENCTRVVGSSCEYTCNKFHTPNSNYPKALCQGNEWSPNSSSLCLDTLCEDNSLTNGKVTGNCSKKIGEDCPIECNQGYANITYRAFCRNDKKWAPGNACKAITCPTSVPNGEIVASCDLAIGSTCAYKCNSGYNVSKVHPNVTCNLNGAWDTDNLCLVDQTSTSGAYTFPDIAIGFSVLGIIVLILPVAIGIIIWRWRKLRTPSKFNSFDNSVERIDGRGYRQRTSFSRSSMEFPNYFDITVGQMKPVKTSSFPMRGRSMDSY